MKEKVMFLISYNMSNNRCLQEQSSPRLVNKKTTMLIISVFLHFFKEHYLLFCKSCLWGNEIKSKHAEWISRITFQILNDFDYQNDIGQNSPPGILIQILKVIQ